MNAYAIQKERQTTLRVCVQVRIKNCSRNGYLHKSIDKQTIEKSRPVIHRTDLHSDAKTFRRREITLISYEEGYIHENFIYW